MSKERSTQKSPLLGEPSGYSKKDMPVNSSPPTCPSCGGLIEIIQAGKGYTKFLATCRSRECQNFLNRMWHNSREDALTSLSEAHWPVTETESATK